ncbi:MAG: hypothetical protein J6P75_03345 [Bacteroidales bacterium]|nr:hypothetical protein [Bacteroidales bacterium]MBP5786666.1 hypothetical protein [Kiritimatiellia bacterium]
MVNTIMIRIANLALVMIVGVVENTYGWDKAIESVELKEFVYSTRINRQQKRIKFLMDYSAELKTRIQTEVRKNGLSNVDLQKFGALELRGDEGEVVHADILNVQTHIIHFYEDYCNTLENLYVHILANEDEVQETKETQGTDP